MAASIGPSFSNLSSAILFAPCFVWKGSNVRSAAYFPSDFYLIGPLRGAAVVSFNVDDDLTPGSSLPVPIVFKYFESAIIEVCVLRKMVEPIAGAVEARRNKMSAMIRVAPVAPTGIGLRLLRSLRGGTKLQRSVCPISHLSLLVAFERIPILRENLQTGVDCCSMLGGVATLISLKPTSSGLFGMGRFPPCASR